MIVPSPPKVTAIRTSLQLTLGVSSRRGKHAWLVAQRAQDLPALLRQPASLIGGGLENQSDPRRWRALRLVLSQVAIPLAWIPFRLFRLLPAVGWKANAYLVPG